MQENDSNRGTLLPPIAYSKLAVREIDRTFPKLFAFSGPPLQCSRDRPSSVCFRHGHPMRLGTTGDALSRRLPSPRALLDGLCEGRSGSQAGTGSCRHMAAYASTLSHLWPRRGAPGAVAHRGLRLPPRQHSGLTLVDQHSANSARHHLNLHFTDPPSTKTPIQFIPPAPARLAG